MDTAPKDQGRKIERSARNIHAGGWALEQHQPIATLLGSCIAVCLHDPKLHIGGMNHFMLPSRKGGHYSEQDALLRGDYAMEVLVNAMLARGALKNRLTAKIFGGGNIVSSIRLPIGERNAQFAREWLKREGIVLLASDCGGSWARKVLFEPDSGTAWCKRFLGSMTIASEVARAEAEYAKSLSQPTSDIDKRIELF